MTTTQTSRDDASASLLEDSSRLMRGSRRTTSHRRPAWVHLLISVALLACFPRSAQGQLTLETCIEQLNAADLNSDGVISRVEYMNFIVRASPFAADGCPNLSNIRDFLQGGKYYQTLQTASCYCQEYDNDAACCLTPQLIIDGSYPAQYVQRICVDVAAVVDANCNPNATPVSPTQAPTEAIIVRDGETTAPTFAPTANTQGDSGDNGAVGGQDSDKDNEQIDSGDKPNNPDRDIGIMPFSEDDEKGFRALPLWLQIAIPAAAVLFCVFCVLLVGTHRRPSSGSKHSQAVARGLTFEDGDHDSLKGYPEILEETDVEDTERSIEMEEGVINEEMRQLEKKQVSWSEPLPQPLPKSPSRMSQVLDSLELDETPLPPKQRKRKGKSKGKTTKSKSKKKAQAAAAAKTSSGADSSQRMSEFVNTLDRETRSTKSMLPSTAPADPRERMGGFFRDSASAASDASQSSAEIFMDDQDDDGEATSGTPEGSGQIKWRLLHPTTLVNTGAVEVFPLPPAVTNLVVATSSSSSSSYPEDSGESKEDDSSVSDMYHDDSETDSSVEYSSREFQPDPDGVRLEDGRHYREQWLRDNGK